MEKILPRLCLTLAVLLGSTGASWSGDLQKGLIAYLKKDYATALRNFKPLAEKGDEFAQNFLGMMYSNGQGVLQDYKTAMKWFRLAAEQGRDDAQSNLGVMYEKERGVPQDYKTAVKWYRLAAEQGNDLAQFNLGMMYKKGQGVPKDYPRAHMWFNIAASSGNKNAISGRDAVSKRMTPADISKAQDLARECVFKKYKGC